MFFYNIFKVNYSLLTGALTLSIMVLPTIIRTTQEAIKTVPMGYREGAVGLGAPKWHTIRTVVLPSCIDGILTSVILSIGRIVGESAALIFTAGIAAEVGINSLGDIFGKVMNQGGSLTVQLLPVRTAWRCRNEVRILYGACTACNSTYNQHMRKAGCLQNKKETLGIMP